MDSYNVMDRYKNTYLVTHDEDDDSYACECKLFGRHGYPCSHMLFYVFNSNGLECILDKYCESRWLKTPLIKAVHRVFDDTLPTNSVVDERVTLSNEGIVMVYGFLRQYEKGTEVLRTFLGRIKEAGDFFVIGSTRYVCV